MNCEQCKEPIADPSDARYEYLSKTEQVAVHKACVKEWIAARLGGPILFEIDY